MVELDAKMTTLGHSNKHDVNSELVQTISTKITVLRTERDECAAEVADLKMSLQTQDGEISSLKDGINLMIVEKEKRPVIKKVSDLMIDDE